MRILEAITPSVIGGAEIYTAALANQFAHAGVHCEIFCPKGRKFAEYARRQGLSVSSWKTFGKVDPYTALRLAGFLRKKRIDVVHTHLSTASLIGAIAAKIAKVPCVSHVHGFTSAAPYRFSDRIIAVSQAVADHLESQKIATEKITVIHNGIDSRHLVPIEINEAKKEIGIPQETPVIGVFGRLDKVKGQDVAIETISKLHYCFSDARLLVCGTGKDENYLRRLARERGVDDRTIFTGFVEDTAKYMCACDVVFVPSRKEAFGLACAEAMALARPVVATKVGGLAEIIGDEDAGFTVTRSSPKHAAKIMRSLIENKQLAEDTGKRARERVLQHFNIEDKARDILALFEELTAKKRKNGF